MPGINKRPAGYVPAEYRSQLDQLSKADLMEVAYSFALMLEEDDFAAAFKRVVDEYGILARNGGRKPKQISA